MASVPFLMPSVEYLGHQVNTNEFQAVSSKVEALVNTPTQVPLHPLFITSDMA